MDVDKINALLAGEGLKQGEEVILSNMSRWDVRER